MSRTVLIVDDDLTLVRILQKAMTDAGYRVLMAYDGDEALGKIASENIDMILLDIQMPKINGYSFLFKMRKIDGRGDIPVVVLTSSQSMKDMFMAEGVREYLVKPYPVARLMDKVRQYVQPG